MALSLRFHHTATYSLACRTDRLHFLKFPKPPSWDSRFRV